MKCESGFGLAIASQPFHRISPIFERENEVPAAAVEAAS